MPERIKLFVTEVKDIQAVGSKGAKKLAFKAKDSNDKELSYFTFTTGLFEHIKPNTEIEAEVEVTEREYEGNTYVDRKVTQLYIDGKPVSSQKSGWSGSRGRSAEEIQSIENQVRAKIIAELWVADKLNSDDAEVVALRQWLKPLGGKQQEVPPEATKSKSEPPPEQTNGELFAWLNESMNKNWKEKSWRSWLVNVCKIDESLIDIDPEAVKKEVAELQGWK